jgi:hypothetical protein
MIQAVTLLPLQPNVPYMECSILGSIPVRCSIRVGKLWPFCTALLRFILWVLLRFIKVVTN